MNLHALLAQATTVAAEHWETLVLGSGPLGLISWWLARLVEKQNKAMEARDALYTKAMNDVAHKLNGMSRALIYNAAAHGPGEIRQMAKKELDRLDSPQA